MAVAEHPPGLEKRGVGKKFVVACDGTWMNSDQGYDTSLFAPPTAQIPTNVTRLVRALTPTDASGTPQIAFYQRGIGANGGTQDSLLGGLTGSGLSEHVREAYGFLANNFSPHSQKELLDTRVPMDEVVLAGFSRGAFTARAIASLVSDVGLLTKRGLEAFWGVFGDWMKQNCPEKESEWFKKQYGVKVAFTDPKYRQTLIDNGLTRWPIPIRAIAVWETVGSLGIPLPFTSQNVKEYSFVNTKVAQQVHHAFHALALDEHRNLFTPTLWEQPSSPNNLQTLAQCWFPGVHSNIGGSYPDAGIANISLAWMISKLEDTDGGILQFDASYLDWLQDLNSQYYEKEGDKGITVRSWGMGRLYDSDPGNSVQGILQGLAPIVRMPGRYFVCDSTNGKVTETLLKGTHETIHSSVRIRTSEHGGKADDDSYLTEAALLLNKAKHLFGLGGKEDGYKSQALRDYELVLPVGVKGEEDHARVGKSGVVWKGKAGKGDLLEDELGGTELRLLRRSVGEGGKHH